MATKSKSYLVGASRTMEFEIFDPDLCKVSGGCISVNLSARDARRLARVETRDRLRRETIRRLNQTKGPGRRRQRVASDAAMGLLAVGAAASIRRFGAAR